MWIVAASLSLAQAAVKEGDVFPRLADAGLAGALPETAGKVVVIDFFASWCGPCKSSIPALSKLQAEYAARGVVVIGVGIDEQAEKHTAFVARLAPKFATVHDRGQQLVRAVEVPSMPTTFIVGRDGRVRLRHTGYHGAATEREWRAALDAALAAP